MTSEQSREPFRRALASLHALDQVPVNDILRDAWIQRFEYTIEAAWKATRKALIDQNIEPKSPREAFRMAGQMGLIDYVALWLNFLDKRNLTVHAYNEAVAVDVFSIRESFAKAADELLATLAKLEPH